jgi:hypothetical protein
MTVALFVQLCNSSTDCDTGYCRRQIDSGTLTQLIVTEIDSRLLTHISDSLEMKNEGDVKVRCNCDM